MNGSYNELAQHLLERRVAVEEWLAAEFAKQHLPFYCSVDLRVSSNKGVPVDANLFPGGFNNLASELHAQASQAAAAQLKQRWPKVRRIGLLVERFTRNPYYASHLSVLSKLLRASGAEVRLAFDGDSGEMPSHHDKIAVSALGRRNDTLHIDDFEPEMILLNSDLSGGVPDILRGVSQPIEPPLEAGWSYRRKSTHFFQYERVAARFARAFAIDPWSISAYFNVCNRVDVSRRVGLDCLTRAVEETLADIRQNYNRYRSDTKPFVVLKADAGTYGMGVVMVEDAAEVRKLNRRKRQNLSVVKDGAVVRDILIQEGIPTTDRIEGLVAEPVYYMVGTRVIGGFWRLHESGNTRQNLNSRGMLFWPMAENISSGSASAFTHRVLARLALLSTARELASDLT